jgi:oligopeptide transport system substrate-binding protein
MRKALQWLVVVGVLVSGCGQRSADQGAVASPGPAILRRGLGAEPATLDPRRAEDNAALAVAADLHEGLTRLGTDGSVQPGAAESWTVSDDFRVFRFQLRPGLRWSNGDPLTASQFAAGLRLLTAADSLSPVSGLFDAIGEIDVPDPRSVRITLQRPLPYLPALLALPAAAPLHPAAVAPDFGPASGAFRIRERIVGERISLQRNPHYWDAARVRLDGVEHLTVADLGTELNLYRTGELDLTSEVPNTHIAELRASLPGELRIAPYLGVYSYAVNMARLPDPDARRALALAVDRERITRQVTGAGEIPAYGWIPDGIPAYTPARFVWLGLPRGEAAPLARDLWANARRHGGAPSMLTLCTDASANHHRTAVALADLWKSALGIETRIVELEWAVYLEARRSSGDCDLLRLGWSADFVDPEAFAAVFESGHPQNTLGYSSPSYDLWLARSRAAATTDERMTALRHAEEQLLQDVAVIPVFFRVTKRLVKPHVAGVTSSPLGLLPSRELQLVTH